MQKTILLLSFLLWRISFVMAQQDSVFSECVNCPLPIKDITQTIGFIQVSGAVNNNLADTLQGLCAVKIKFEHEYLGDLSVKLQSPAGQVIDLMGPVFLYGETDGTVWDIRFVSNNTVATPDTGFLNVWSNNQIWGIDNSYTGSYYPFAGALDSFNTGPVNGIWQVTFDDQQPLDSGLVYHISLEFCDQTGQDSVELIPPDALGVLNTEAWGVSLLDTSTNNAFIKVIWGDGTNSGNIPAGSNLVHDYAQTGIYPIQLIAYNSIGADTLHLEANIVGALPSAELVIPNPWCNTEVKRIQLVNMDHVDEISWVFLNGIPSFGTGPYIDLFYNQPVLDTGMVTITNSVGSVTYNIYTVVSDIPSSSFMYSYQGGTYSFTSTSLLADSLVWIINGVVVSNDSNFSFVPPFGSVNIEVNLLVYNPCGSSAFFQFITVSDTEDATLLANGIRIFPNPVTKTSLTLETTAKTSDEYRWTLVDASGKTHESGQFIAPAGLQQHALPIGEHPAGVYWLHLQNSRESLQKRLIIQH